MNWYIGQDVVAVANSSCGIIKKGQTFVIKSLKSGFCNCHKVLIDVGLTTICSCSRCRECGSLNFIDGIGWKSERLFAPLDQDISELTEILKSKQPFEL